MNGLVLLPAIESPVLSILVIALSISVIGIGGIFLFSYFRRAETPLTMRCLFALLLNIALLGMVLSFATGSMYWQMPTVIVVVSLVYSATRFDDWPSILTEAFRWGWRMAFFLVSIAAGLYVLAEYL